MRDLIEEAVREYFGERCPDFIPGCLCCQAWAEYDRLYAADSKGREDSLKVKVVSVTDEEDGTATIVFDMSPDALIAFAQRGLHHALTEAAERDIDHGEITQEDPHRGDDAGRD